MSLLDPIVPYLGPLGPALAVSGTLVVILGLIGILSFMLYKVKRDIFETSVGWVGATVVLSLITILFRGMTYLCGCAWYYDAGGNPTALVPLTYMLVTGSFFAIIYNFNIPPLKKHKWLISIPLSVPIAIVSNLFFPLVENGISSTPPLVFIEIAFLAPLGAIYSSFVYERAVLHMGDYHARLRRFLEQGQKGQKGKKGDRLQSLRQLNDLLRTPRRRPLLLRMVLPIHVRARKRPRTRWLQHILHPRNTTTLHRLRVHNRSSNSRILLHPTIHESRIEETTPRHIPTLHIKLHDSPRLRRSHPRTHVEVDR